MLPAIGQLLLGLVVLTVGGHFLVRAAISLALLARISTAVVGLTVVAFGTSLPELAVSVQAAARGSTDISYANVIGSNLFNMAVILGLVALIRPIPVSRVTFRFEYPVMAAALVLCVVTAWNGIVDRGEGVVMLLLLTALGVFLVLTTKRGEHVLPEVSASEQEVVEAGTIHGQGWQAWLLSGLLISLGIAALTGGANLIVRGAETIAIIMGVSQRIIGLTVIAMGTSLPELATTLIATRKGESAIALSNLMGSNIFNVLGILGTTSALFPVPVNPRAANLDNWVMLAFTVALLPILARGRRVQRWEGAVLLTGFTAYMVVLVRQAGW